MCCKMTLFTESWDMTMRELLKFLGGLLIWNAVAFYDAIFIFLDHALYVFLWAVAEIGQLRFITKSTFYRSTKQ